jgi:hypothetical protein
MIPRTVLAVSLCLLVLGLPAAAQSNELAISGGGQISFNPNSNVGTGVLLQGSYARRLIYVPTVALYAEFPLAAAFKVNSELPSNIAQGDYSSLFITPGLKLKLVPEAPVSPFFTVGFGWARFRQESTGTLPDVTTNTNVTQFGFGTDFKIAPYVSVRTEIRDYFSGPLGFNGSFTDRQHNIAASAGVVFRL